MKREPSPFTIDWHGHELRGTATFYPGDPGRTFGPPEKCYPPEPDELDIVTLTYRGVDVLFILDHEPVLEDITGLILKTYEVDQDYPEYEPEEPYEDPVQADADVLRSAGMGTDEDYGYYGENE